MKNKGTVIFFSIALAVVSIYQLSFTYVASNVEKAARLANTKNDTLDDRGYKRYLDSIDGVEVYNLGLVKYSYAECKQRELNLGLDLQGGMNVILEISKADIIEAMAGINDSDKDFIAALAKAKVYSTNTSGDFEDLFARAWNEIAPDRKLAPIFANKDNQERINYDSENEDVLKYIKSEASGAIDRAYEVIETRISQSNVSQPNIQRLDGGRISVELPGVDNPSSIRKLLQASAKLEFWEVAGNSPQNQFKGYKLLQSINDALAAKNATEVDTAAEEDKGEDLTKSLMGDDTTEEVEEEVSTDSLDQDSIIPDTGDVFNFGNKDSGAIDSTNLTDEEYRKQNPLFTVLVPPIDNQGQLVPRSEIGYVDKSKKDQVDEILSDPEIRKSIPSNIRFAWGAETFKNDAGRTIYSLYALSGSTTGESQLSGDIIVDARPTTSQTGQIEVLMKMNDFGANEWKALTKKNIGEYIAIVLDDKVYSAPTVQGEIPNGISTISGQFDIKEADFLANVLKAGKLPAPATIVAEDVVGPTLGQENIRYGFIALAIGFIAVILFMVLYYNKGGFIADLAVLANVFLILGVLASYGAALTLPGIAGIVLTIGMAVDANVLIFERIKEELAHGKTLKSAISGGYKHAMWSIIDANVTTLLAGVILATAGSGPVYGFAVILIIGIFSSLFTSLLLTRLVIEGRVAKGKSMTFYYSWSQHVLRNVSINFIGNRKKYYIASALIIVAGIVAYTQGKIDSGIDFKGGWSYQMQFDKKADIASSDIKALLDDNLDNSSNEVKTIGTDNKFKIVTTYMLEDEGTEVADSVETKLISVLATKFDIDKDDLLQSAKVGPTIAQNIRTKSMNRMIVALIVMFLYIVIRFKRWGFGLGATIALFHDVLIVFSLFALLDSVLPFAMELDQAFIAAILTVIGYSINDSVVVFDRVREYLRENRSEKDIPALINTAINDTLSRTVVTSLTTILVILILFLFGGDALKGFTFALLIGVVVGTYSSACIATPIVVDVSKIKRRKIK
jgi:SecD/SecF fusion protein